MVQLLDESEKIDNDRQLLILSYNYYGIIESSSNFYTVRFDVPFERFFARVPNLFIDTEKRCLNQFD